MKWKKTVKWIGIVVHVLLIVFVILLHCLTPMLNGNESNTTKYFN